MPQLIEELESNEVKFFKHSFYRAPPRPERPSSSQSKSSSQPCTSAKSMYDEESDEEEQEEVEARSPDALTASIRSEISQYQYDKKVEKKSDPLCYWAGNRIRFPLLHQLVQKYLSPKPSTVVSVSERLFSTAGLVFSNRRNRMSGKTLATVLFVNRNQKYWPQKYQISLILF